MKHLPLRNVLLALCMGVALLYASGCMSVPSSLSVSTKPLAPGGYTELGPATGRAVGVMILGIPLSEPYPNRAAVDRAVQKGGGDALINVTSDMAQIMIGPVTFIITTVKGTGVSTNK